MPKERAATRAISVRPGGYFVRARGQDVLYEGPILAAAGGTTDVKLAGLTRIEYAKLVRKGGRARKSLNRSSSAGGCGRYCRMAIDGEAFARAVLAARRDRERAEVEHAVSFAFRASAGVGKRF